MLTVVSSTHQRQRLQTQIYRIIMLTVVSSTHQRQRLQTQIHIIIILSVVSSTHHRQPLQTQIHMIIMFTVVSSTQQRQRLQTPIHIIITLTVGAVGGVESNDSSSSAEERRIVLCDAGPKTGVVTLQGTEVKVIFTSDISINGGGYLGTFFAAPADTGGLLGHQNWRQFGSVKYALQVSDCQDTERTERFNMMIMIMD